MKVAPQCFVSLHVCFRTFTLAAERKCGWERGEESEAMIQAGRGVWGRAGGKRKGRGDQRAPNRRPIRLVKQLGAQGWKRAWGVAWRVAVPTEPVI